MGYVHGSWGKVAKAPQASTLELFFFVFTYSAVETHPFWTEASQILDLMDYMINNTTSLSFHCNCNHDCAGSDPIPTFPTYTLPPGSSAVSNIPTRSTDSVPTAVSSHRTSFATLVSVGTTVATASGIAVFCSI